MRADRPISLAAAFEQPVKMAAEGGYASRSRASLDSYAGNISRLIGTTGQRFQGHATVDAKDREHLGSRVDSYQDLSNGAAAALAAE